MDSTEYPLLIINIDFCVIQVDFSFNGALIIVMIVITCRLFSASVGELKLLCITVTLTDVDCFHSPLHS